MNLIYNLVYKWIIKSMNLNFKYWHSISHKGEVIVEFIDKFGYSTFAWTTLPLLYKTTTMIRQRVRLKR